MMGWHVGNGMGWGGGLYMLIIFVLIVVCGIMIVRWSLRPGGREDSALEILKRRYARGELSKEQFEAMKKDIQ
ncbi:MAG: SHOCT domain-containing protein [Desulfurivibrionaceae bacterium]